MNTHRGKHLAGKRFTQQELNDVACPSYKNYLEGRSQRLPGRNDLNRIADYLECSLQERNHLLSVAHFEINIPVNDDESLQSTLTKARTLMRDLQFPSILLGRDYRIHTLCPNLITLTGMPALDAIPRDQRTLLHVLFHDQWLPHLTRETRCQLQIACVHHFKYANELYRDSLWYLSLFTSMQANPAFNALWRSMTPDPGSQIRLEDMKIQASYAPQSEIVQMNIVHMTFDSDRRTHILSLVPAEEKAREVFAKISCPSAQVSSEDWQTCIRWEIIHRIA